MGERQERIDRLEHGTGHLDGERTARTADLHDQQHDGESLSDISKRHRERVDNIGEHETRDPACQNKLQGVVALDAKEQDVARAHECRLQQGQAAKEQVTAQIDLVQTHGNEFVDELVIDRNLHHGSQHDRADPQRQNRIERCHGRAVVADRIDRLAVERDGARKRYGKTLGIVANHRLDRGKIVRHQGAVELGLEGTDLIGCLAQLIGSLVDQLSGLGKALRERTGSVGQTAHGAIQVTRDTVQRIQNARNGLLEFLGLDRERGIVIDLGTRDTRLGIGDCLVGFGANVIDLCHAVRERCRDARQLLGIVAILRRDFAQLCSRVLKPRLELVVAHLIGKIAELIRRGVDLVGTRIERRCAVVELGHRQVNMLVRSIKGLCELGGYVVERPGTPINRGIDRVAGGLERLLGINDAAFGMLHQLLHRCLGRTGLLEQTTRRRQRIRR